MSEDIDVRVYPTMIKDDETKKEEKRVSIDVEDMLEKMIDLEFKNNNVLENWYEIKMLLLEIVRASIDEKLEDKKDELPSS